MRDVFVAHEVALEFARSWNENDPMGVSVVFQAIEDEDNQLLLVSALSYYLQTMLKQRVDDINASEQRIAEAEERFIKARQTVLDMITAMPADTPPGILAEMRARAEATGADWEREPTTRPVHTIDTLINQLIENTQRGSIKWQAKHGHAEQIDTEE